MITFFKQVIKVTTAQVNLKSGATITATIFPIPLPNVGQKATETESFISPNLPLNHSMIMIKTKKKNMIFVFKLNLLLKVSLHFF